MIIKSFPQDIDLIEENPFGSSFFYTILEESSSVAPNTGWTPAHFKSENAILPGYFKDHSYGEYIFDWSWADFYAQMRVPYYPKLIHMVPFSPVNSPKFLNCTDSQRWDLSTESYRFYQESALNSEHYLFTGTDEAKILPELGFHHLKSIQYHFKNKYSSFNEFLSTLKPGRRKMIRKERSKIEKGPLKIDTFSGETLTTNMVIQFYLFYLATIQKKQSYPYLTESFFELLAKRAKEHIIINTAKENDTIIAMSLFLKGKTALYGRYWGILPEYENLYPGLHFELCYYKGIDFCIDQKIKLFEAGAQGEHKLWRGFEPVQINSFHHIKNQELSKAIQADIYRQNELNDLNMKKLYTLLPYK